MQQKKKQLFERSLQVKALFLNVQLFVIITVKKEIFFGNGKAGLILMNSKVKRETKNNFEALKILNLKISQLGYCF